LLALGAMFFQQTFVALGKALPAVIAPAIIADLHINAAWVGIYFGLSAAASLVAQLGCGSFIVRHGALRMTEISLAMIAAGTAIAAFGTPLMLVLSAIVCGIGGAVSTPASSHLLSRVSSARYLPLVFSVKQTAVPAGMLLAGAFGPLLTQWRDWRFTMLLIAGVSAVFVLMLEPLRKIFDTDCDPTRTFRMSDFRTTLAEVLGTRELRALSFACLAFNGMQATITAYFVVYLTVIGYTPVAAGFLFSVAVAVAVPGRIVWGWLGSTYVTPRFMMATLAIGMAASVVLLAIADGGWPTLLVGLVSCALSATALSWHGILLAETARAAPDGMRGGVTGGVLAFGQVGALVLPLVYSGLLDWTGSYGIGLAVCGIPALLIGLQLMRDGTSAARTLPMTRSE
jgi:MFS family permease